MADWRIKTKTCAESSSDTVKLNWTYNPLTIGLSLRQEQTGMQRKFRGHWMWSVVGPTTWVDHDRPADHMRIHQVWVIMPVVSSCHWIGNVIWTVPSSIWLCEIHNQFRCSFACFFRPWVFWTTSQVIESQKWTAEYTEMKSALFWSIHSHRNSIELAIRGPQELTYSITRTMTSQIYWPLTREVSVD